MNDCSFPNSAVLIRLLLYALSIRINTHISKLSSQNDPNTLPESISHFKRASLPTPHGLSSLSSELSPADLHLMILAGRYAVPVARIIKRHL